MTFDLRGRSHIDVQNEFEILGVLGKGSFGQVFKAQHKSSGKIIALKKQNIKEADNAELIREVRIMESMKSPYIVGYFGSSLQGDVMWIVMEYCCYGSVNDLMTLTKKTFTEQQIATLCRSSLEALVYMRSVNKIHRDIKPHNILVNEKGEAKLCDFGISSSLGPGEKRKTVIGTPYYLAPEIIQEDGYDFKCDVWALGITCIELAEYNPPLHDAHPMRVLFMIPLNPPPTLTNPEHWSFEFNDFIVFCLKKNPAERAEPGQLLIHDFIRKKAHVQTLMPYLKNVSAIIESYGGLDNALREVQLKPDDPDSDVEADDVDSFDEKELFGDYSPEEARSNDDREFQDFPEESLLYTGSADEEDSDDEDSLNLDDPDEEEYQASDEEPPKSDKLENVDADALFQLDVRRPKPLVPPVNLQVISLEQENDTKCTARSPVIRSKVPISQRGNVIPISSRTVRGLKTIRSPRTPIRLGKITDRDSGSAREIFSRNQIDINRLTSSDTNQPAVTQDETSKLKVDSIAEQMRPKIDDESKNGYDDFKKYYPDHLSFTFRGVWKGLNLVKNPWRNHQQYKVSISSPTILCLVITADYHGKHSVPMLFLNDKEPYEGREGHISVTVIALQDTTRQVIQKPRSVHTKFRWEDNTHSERSLQIYLEDPNLKYVIVPTVSVLGDAVIDYRFQIFYPSEVQLSVEKLPIMRTQTIHGEWNTNTAGGTVDGIEWRKNPQFLLEVWEPSNLNIFLSQYTVQPKQMHNVGFYVIKVPNLRRKKLLSIDYEQLVVKGQGWRRAQEVTTRSPLFVEKGLYVIIPCTFYPRKEAKFSLAIASETCHNFQINEISLPYYEQICEGRWTEEESGGCTQNPDWINNPRFLLTTTSDISITFFVDRKPWAKVLKKQKEFVGIYLFKANAYQYASLCKDNLVSKTKQFSDAKEVEWKVKKLKKGTYIVLVSTFEPNNLGKFIFRAYSLKPFQMETLLRPPMVTLLDEWNETNCGGAFNFGNWRKNPQFFLRSEVQAKVEIMLELGHNTTGNRTVPPTTTLSGYDQYFGFYIFRGYNDKKIMKINKGDVVEITEFQQQKKRIICTATLQTTSALIIMPTPFEPNINCKFSLSVVGVSPNQITFTKITDRLRLYTYSSCWSVANGTAGGCHNFSKGASEQWLDNPRIIVCGKKFTNITVVLKQDPKVRNPIIAGIYLLSAKKNTKLTKRSVLTVSEFCASQEVVLADFVLQKGEFYMLLLSAFNPGEENSFTVDLYATHEIVWKPVILPK